MDTTLSATEETLNRFLETVWTLKRDKQEAAREQAIRDTIALDDERARWEQWSPVVQRSSGRAEYEYGELQ